MALSFAGNNVPGWKNAKLTPIEEMRQSQLSEMIQEAREKGWKQASFINLAPWTQNAQSILLNGLRVSGVPLAKERWAASQKIKLRSGLEIPFVQHVITVPAYTVLEQVVGPIDTASSSVKNKTWWPYDLAADMVTGNNAMQHRGGAFCYKGSHVPLFSPKYQCLKITAVDSEFPGDIKGCGCPECVQDVLEEAYSQSLRFYELLFNQAASAHASGDKVELRNVHQQLHGAAIRYMRLTGVLQVDPPFLTEIQTTSQKAPQFCVCGKEAPRGASVCAACHYIIDPFEAFKKGVFDLETPGALTALRRLTKEQLKELKLYPHLVKTQDEYIAEKFAESAEHKKAKAQKQESAAS